MKIGIFTDCYYPQINGVVTSIMTLKNTLEKAGHTVYIITVYDSQINSNDQHIITIPSIPFVKWSEFKLGVPFLAFKAYRIIKTLHFDIVHTQTEFTIGTFGKKIAAKLNIPLVHTYHTQHEEYTHYISKIGTPLLKKMVRKLSKIFLVPYSIVIVPSEKIKKLLVTYGVRNPIYVVPTGIAFSYTELIADENKQSLKKQLNITKDQFILLFLGRISLEKNIDTIINILPAVIEKNTSIRVIIVGDGPHLKHIQKRAIQQNLSNFIRFTGKIPHKQIAHYFALADLFISPSKTETQGLTIFEAIEQKIPVLVYDDTNIENIVIDHKTGLLFKTEEELKKSILFAVDNKQLLKQYAEAAYENIQNYSDESFAAQILNIYHKAISNHIHERL